MDDVEGHGFTRRASLGLAALADWRHQLNLRAKCFGKLEKGGRRGCDLATLDPADVRLRDAAELSEFGLTKATSLPRGVDDLTECVSGPEDALSLD